MHPAHHPKRWRYVGNRFRRGLCMSKSWRRAISTGSATSLLPQNPIRPMRTIAEKFADVFAAWAAALMCSRRFNSRSEEHTSELQSHLNLVCRLLLEKKKNHKGNQVVCDIFKPW